MLQQVLLDGIAVEPGHSAESPGDGGAGSAAGLHVPSEELDVGAVGLEQMQVVLDAPAGELAQVQGVRVVSQPAVTSKEARTASFSFALNIDSTATSSPAAVSA